MNMKLTIIGIGITLVGAIASASPSLAQSQSPLEDFQSPQNERDSFYGGTGGSGFSVFNLLHNAQLGQTRDLGEFSTQQQTNINNAADEFRRLQLQRLGNPQLPVVSDPVTAPTTPTP